MMIPRKNTVKNSYSVSRKGDQSKNRVMSSKAYKP